MTSLFNHCHRQATKYVLSLSLLKGCQCQTAWLQSQRLGPPVLAAPGPTGRCNPSGIEWTKLSALEMSSSADRLSYWEWLRHFVKNDMDVTKALPVSGL